MCHCSAAPFTWPAPPRTPTPRKAHSTPPSHRPPLPSPCQCHLNNAIRTMPQHTHCRLPTLHSQGRCEPQNAVARPPPPLPFPLPMVLQHCCLKMPGHAHHRTFSLPLPTQKQPDNAMARRRRHPPSKKTMQCCQHQCRSGAMGNNARVRDNMGCVCVCCS